MLNYSEIKERKYIVLEGEPYEVLESSIKKKNRQKPANQTKLRHLINGSVKQVAFHQSDNVEEADISKKAITYSFSKIGKKTNEREYWFYEGEDKSKRFALNANIIGNKYLWLKENAPVDALYFNDEVIGLQIPIKIELKVKDAPPAVKGNTSSGATKTITLETGATVTTPLFIKEGDVVVVNTDTGQYVERAR